MACGWAEDGFSESECFDDSAWCECEDLADCVCDFALFDFFGALALDPDACWFCDADGVAELEFADVCESCCDDVFGDVSCHVCCGAVYFCWVFSAECAAAVSSASAVGIDDDFSSCESSVAVGAADFEASCWVDVDGDSGVPPLTEHGFEDVLDDLAFEFVLLVVPLRVVLCAQDDCVYADWFVSFVFDGDLALCVWAEAGDEAFASCVGLL